MNKTVIDFSPSEQCYLDLRALSKRSCLSVRSLRYSIKDPVDPLPHFRCGQKILIYWPEFILWMDRKRENKPVEPDADGLADEILESLR